MYAWQGFDGYDKYGGELGADGLPKCFWHDYCFCNGGKSVEDCGDCDRVKLKRKEGHLVILAGDMKRAYDRTYVPNRMVWDLTVWPNSRFVKEYRAMKIEDEALANENATTPK